MYRLEIQHIVLFSLSSICCLSACRETNVFVPPPPPKVTVAQPLTQEVRIFTEFPGRTEATQTVEIRARVQGFLDSVEFEEGAFVEAGTLLYKIEPDQYEALVQSATAMKEGTDAELVRATAELERVQQLHADGNAPDKELVDTQTALDLAKAAALAADAELKKAELDLSYTKIFAPIAGRVNRTTVDVGNLVGRDQGVVLTTIVPWDPIYVFVTVDERKLLEVNRRSAETGRKLSDVEAYLKLTDGSDYPVVGHLDYIDNQIDPRTGTLQARAIFDNPDDLLIPGSFVRARFPSPPQPAVLVPEEAVQRDLSGSFVFVVDTSGVVQRMDVEPGRTVPPYREIASGLSGDERVIIRGFQRVRAGAKADAETAELPPVQETVQTPVPDTAQPAEQPTS